MTRPAEPHPSSTERIICPQHFEDSYLRTFIAERLDDSREDTESCSFCSENPGVPFSEVVELVEDAIGRHFDTAADSGVPYAEGEWQWPTMDTWDVLDDLAEWGIAFEVVSELRQELEEEAWVRKGSPMRSASRRLQRGWQDFVQHVQNTSRFLLRPDRPRSEWDPDPDYDPREAVEAIGKVILHSFDLITTLKAGTPLFRARTFNDRRPEKAHEMVSPSPRQASQGRMNGAGISVFYGALDADTAAAEVYDGKDFVQVAELRPIRDLAIADLTKVPDLSPFDPAVKGGDFENAAFLKGFVRDVARPIVRDGREHFEYAPTQYLTEYLRWQLEPPYVELDGIAFPSARTEGTNIVVFVGPEGCLDDLQLPSGTKRPDGASQLLRLEPFAEVRTYGPPQSRVVRRAKVEAEGSQSGQRSP